METYSPKPRLYGALQSSQDPTEVANKVKGAILMASSVIIFFAGRYFGITLTDTDILQLATELSGVAGAVWTIYGFILHLVTWLGTVRSRPL